LLTDKIKTETLGCRLNAYESSVMEGLAEDANLANKVIINTCAVTKEAVRKSRQLVRKSRSKWPDAKIVVTGCAAQIDPHSFSKIEGVDWVVGNDSKLEARLWEKLTDPEFANIENQTNILVEDIMEVKEITPHLAKGLGTRAVAYLQIQNGCDHRCTFCIIPYGRGNSRSVPAGVIVNQIRDLVQAGYNEVVLTGVDLTSWGGDLVGKPGIGNLVARILKLVPELPRLRISSVDPAEIDKEFIEVVSNNERLMPHLHLSLQAGDNMILKRMKRRHTREEAIEFCNKIKQLRPEMTFGADLIAGFPTETDEMFKNTLNILDDCQLTWLHIFPYSPREGTPAARMPQVNVETIRERACQLREYGKRRVDIHLEEQVGRTLDTLVESPLTGRTSQYAVVKLPTKEVPGSIIPLAITGFEDGNLVAHHPSI